MLRLLGNARCRTADMEGTHRELRAGLADRLGGDDTDRFADLDLLAAGQVAAVAAAQTPRRVSHESTERIFICSIPAS